MSDLLKAALVYATRGWPVFPAVPGGKTPLTSHGFKDASVDESQIREWWTKWPNANVAVVTGAEAGLYVLDIDPRHFGDVELEDLCKPVDMPDTMVAQTGGGGNHYYFSMPTDGKLVGNATNIRPGIDVRGEGGYVIAPPSSLESGGSYIWESEDYQLAETPAWLMPLLKYKNNGKGDTTTILSPNTIGSRIPPDVIPDGDRNVRLTQLAGSMRRYGSTMESILAALRKESETRCKPPLEESEIQRIAESISSYQPEMDIYALTDSGNADRLMALYGDQLRYVYDWQKWIIWDGNRWQPDKTQEIQRLALDVVRRIYGGASEIQDGEKRRDMVKHALQSEALWRRRAMVELAQPLAPASMEDLDKDTMLLTVRNGTVDLRTGMLRESDPADRITKLADVSYEAGADAPVFKQFLQQIFSGDEALIRFVQKAIGYSLTGETTEQCVFICYGTGSNGKSTLLGAIQRMLCDYAIATPASAILQKRNESTPNDLARLRGVRYTTLLEIEQGRKVDEPLLKAMTGNDTIAARFLYSEYFDLVPQFKLWLGTNHKPKIFGADAGIWRRIRLIPFTVQVPDHEQDKQLSEKLDAERSGILNWALEGCLAWQQEGLQPPFAVVTATAEYRSEEDILGDFLAACLEPANNEDVVSNELYTAYKEWCETAGEKVQSQRWLTMRLEERGYDRHRLPRHVIWRNVRIKTESM